MYHAGGLADVHKHVLLARALAHLRQDASPLLYVETHAGRGRYFLDSPPARKTGEAAAGIEQLLAIRAIIRDEPFLRALKAVQAGNRQLYPGSPLLVASMLRAKDRLWLWELHPREHGWLQRLLAHDVRVRVAHADGLLSLPLKLPPRPPAPERGLVLIDPSYETKAEFEQMPAFVERLRQRWPSSSGILWYPMLPAGRHENLRQMLLAANPDARTNELTWAKPNERRGLYGSGVVGWGLPHAQMAEKAFALPEATAQD